jgi:hypothetical protein
MHGLSRVFITNWNIASGWTFSTEVVMAEVIEGEEIGRGIIEDPGFPYILMLIHMNSTIFSKMGSST